MPGRGPRRSERSGGSEGRSYSSRQSRSGSSRRDRAPSSREGRAGSERQGRSQPPRGGSSQTALIVGGTLGAIALIAGVAFLMGGSSSGRSHSRRRSSYSVPSGAISPAEARRLKRLGIVEFKKGNSLYRQAGAFGSPGYADKVAEARTHLNKAIDHFGRAEDVLRNDYELQEYSLRCGRILSACFKVPIQVR